MTAKKKIIKKEIEETEEFIPKLTTQLDNSMEGDSSITMENPVNLKEVFTEIENILMNINRPKKSNLIGDNVKGIIIALWFNSFFEQTLGKEFRLEILDDLINNKLSYIMSVDKIGSENLLRGISSLSPQITSIMPPTLLERFTGLEQNPQQKLR